jgi:hypothetical protein
MVRLEEGLARLIQAFCDIHRAAEAQEVVR